MKAIITSGLLLGAAHGLMAPAIAGPYVNVEANSGFTGSDYSGTSTDFHVGYEGSSGVLGYYIQGGPSVVSPDGGEADTKFTGKTGGSVAASEKLDIYGEISFAADTVNSYGTKVGVKYKF